MVNEKVDIRPINLIQQNSNKVFFDGDSLKCTVEFKEQKVDFKDRSNGNYPNLLQLYKG